MFNKFLWIQRTWQSCWNHRERSQRMLLWNSFTDALAGLSKKKECLSDGERSNLNQGSKEISFFKATIKRKVAVKTVERFWNGNSNRRWPKRFLRITICICLWTFKSLRPSYSWDQWQKRRGHEEEKGEEERLQKTTRSCYKKEAFGFSTRWTVQENGKGVRMGRYRTMPGRKQRWQCCKNWQVVTERKLCAGLG